MSTDNANHSRAQRLERIKGGVDETAFLGKSAGQRNARLLMVAPAMLSLLRAITASTIVNGCVNGVPRQDPLLPEPLQKRALELIKRADGEEAGHGAL